MTEGDPVRKVAANSVIFNVLGVIAIHQVGSCCDGSGTPAKYVMDSMGAAAEMDGVAANCGASLSARLRRFSSGVDNLDNSGIASSAVATSRYNSNVATVPARVILSTCRARSIGC